MQNLKGIIAKIILFVLLLFSASPIIGGVIEIMSYSTQIKDSTGIDRTLIPSKKIKTIKDDLEKFPEQYRHVVFKYRKNVPYDIIYNLVNYESGWKETAVGRPNTNGTRDYGLGQLNSNYIDLFISKYAPELEGSFDVFNGEHNLQIAVSLLEYNLSYYQEKGYDYDSSLEKAIMAYNCGRGSVNRNKIPDSTKKYLKKVKGI